MALPNPIYIGATGAEHEPSQIRLLSYGLTSGVQGVLGNADCRITALGAPGPAVQALPGAYNVLAKHLGGSYEGYAGSFDVAETTATISNVSSAGPRSDLVILIIKDPSVTGSGSWTLPADAKAGPYAFVEVIEGVTTTTWDVAQYNNTWSAITLARIDRAANATTVTQGDITDLRSIAALGGTRTVVIENPPVTVPPIAQAQFVQFLPSAVDPNYANPSGGTDATHDYLVADTATKDWPSVASTQVAVPEWAVECDAEFQVFNAQILSGDVFGDLWLDFGGTATTSQTYAIDFDGTPGRWIVPYGRTFTVPTSLRGKLITVRTKFKSRFTSSGQLDAKTGTTTKLSLNFQRVPD